MLCLKNHSEHYEIKLINYCIVTNYTKFRFSNSVAARNHFCRLEQYVHLSILFQKNAKTCYARYLKIGLYKRMKFKKYGLYFKNHPIGVCFSQNRQKTDFQLLQTIYRGSKKLISQNQNLYGKTTKYTRRIQIFKEAIPQLLSIFKS